MPSADPATLETGVKILAILTAIPVVLFALWADYFERYHDQQKQNGGELPPLGSLLQRVRAAGAFAAISQLIIFFSASPIRHAYPITTSVAFLAAVLVQAHLQFSLERKLRALEATGSEQLRLVLRTLFWCTLGGVVFGAVVLMSLRLAVKLGMVLALPNIAVAGLGAVGFVCGLALAMTVNFILAPLAVRKIIPTSALTDPELRRTFEACFSKAGTEPPTLWIMELDRFRAANALVVGIRWKLFSRRNSLKPALLISRSLLSALTPPELEAVLLHEASHLSLEHAKSKFSLIIGLTAGLMFLATLISIAAHLALSAEARGPLVAGFGMFAFIYCFRKVRIMSQLQEIAADRHAVVTLGAEVDALASALRKLDAMNDQSDTQDPAARFLKVPTAHPSTEFRIKVMKEFARIEAAAEAQAPQDSDSEKRAA